MVRQTLDLLCQPVPREPFQGLDNTGMQRAPPLLQQATVGHLVRQGVLEGVFWLREEARLIEELRGLEVGEVAVQLDVWQVSNGSQQRARYLHADDCSGL